MINIIAFNMELVYFYLVIHKIKFVGGKRMEELFLRVDCTYRGPPVLWEMRYI